MRKLPFILPMLLASLCAAQPATQPTLGQQVDLQIAAERAQAQSVLGQLLAAQAQLAAWRNAAQYVPAGADLDQLLASAKPGGRAILTPNGNYPPILTVSLKAANFRLDCNGNSIAINAAPNSSSGISVEAPNFEFCNAKISGTAVAFKIRATAAGFYLHDIFADRQQEFCNIDAGADGGRIVNVTIGKTGGTNVFCSAVGLTILNLRSGGSLGEQCIRIDGKPQRPGNIKIIGCDLTNLGTPKEVITARECDGIFVVDTKITGYCSFGQNDDSVIDDCTGLRMTRCTWTKLRPGGALADCRAGTDAIFDECTVPGSATDAAFAISKRGSIQVRNCHVVGVQSKPLAFAFDTATVQDVSIQPTPIPATQPNH